MQRTTAMKWVAGALVTGLLIAFAHSDNNHWRSVLIVLLIMACNSVAWNLASGYAGVFSLGHHVFFGVGAYTSTMLFLKAGVTPWLGAGAAATMAAAFATAVALIAFRYRLTGVFFGLTTLALGEVARSLAAGWDWIGGPVGLLIPVKNDPANLVFTDRLPYFYIALALLLGFLVITWLVERSKFGYYLKAIREDENAAEASGVDSYRYKTAVMALSAALTGVMGTFYAQFMLFIAPDVVFQFDVMLNMMLGVMVGGPGTLLGPLVGSGLFGLLGELLRNLPFKASTQLASGSKVIYAIALILVSLYLPTGLVGLNLRRRAKATQTSVEERRKHAAA